MPPVAGTTSAATGAQDTFVQTVYQLPVFLRLVVFLSGVSFRVFPLQKRLDHFVLGIEVSHVHHQVLQHEHVAQRSYNRRFTQVAVNWFYAR